MLKETSGFQGVKCLFKMEPPKPQGFAFVISDETQFPPGHLPELVRFPLESKLSSDQGQVSPLQTFGFLSCIGIARDTCSQGFCKEYEIVFVKQWSLQVQLEWGNLHSQGLFPHGSYFINDS